MIHRKSRSYPFAFCLVFKNVEKPENEIFRPCGAIYRAKIITSHSDPKTQNLATRSLKFCELIPAGCSAYLAKSAAPNYQDFFCRIKLLRGFGLEKKIFSATEFFLHSEVSLKKFC